MTVLHIIPEMNSPNLVLRWLLPNHQIDEVIGTNSTHVRNSCHLIKHSRIYILFLLFFTLFYGSVSSQTCQDASVELSADVQTDPPRITLHWKSNASGTQHQVFRKLKSGNAWGNVIRTLDGGDTLFVDSTANVGVSYEYRVVRTGPGYTGYGYINSGIEIPPIEFRGILILVIEETIIDSLQNELDRFISDLEGDGWEVIQHIVSRTESVPSVKAQIVSSYTISPTETKAVLLLGRVPVPYSGEINVDGHTDHTGAYPADVFYADMNGVWTDVAVNNITAADPRNHNVPKDGKYDQGFIPGDLELQVGRIDFANMPAFAKSEVQLLAAYLDKNHAYRHKKFSPVYRAVVDDHFGFFSGEAFAASGWKNFGPLVGQAQVIPGDYFTAMRDSSYLWSYGCGGGWYQGAGGIGSTTDFANADLQGVFTMLFGSYFGDWDTQDNFLRAALAQGKALTNVWSGRPHWQFHHMGLGENIGYSARLSQNNSSLYFPGLAPRLVHMALMGDPTLRNDVLAPVSDVVADASGDGAIISWKPANEHVEGYFIYIREENNSEYQRINEEMITDTFFLQPCVVNGGVHTYMVRAVALVTTASGSYYNMSQGITDTVYVEGVAPAEALATWEISFDEVLFSNLSVHATSWEWWFGDGTMSPEEHPVHVYAEGEYTALLIARNECSVDTFIMEIKILTGLEDMRNQSIGIVFPNPTSGIILFTSADIWPGQRDVKIYNNSGVEVAAYAQIQQQDILDLSALVDGVYFIHLLSDDRLQIQRLVLQH